MHHVARILLAALVLTAGLAASTRYSAEPSVEAASNGAFPLRAAFYYGWFPQAWEQSNIRPFTKYHPTLGWYDTSDEAIVRSQIAAMQYGNIRAGIATWWGQGHYTDTNMRTLLDAGAGSGFRWSVYYEEESTGDPSIAKLQADLAYLRDRWASDPGYLAIDGKFVVFVYADASDGCDMARRWTQANTVGAYLVLKVFHDYQRCAYQPQNWHQYGPAEASSAHGTHSYTISPGFDLVGQPTRLGRDLDRWRQDVRNMAASGADFQLVTTFNEWGEGTSVESASEWATASGYGAYLDALHADGRVQPPPPPAPAVTAAPTAPAPATAGAATPPAATPPVATTAGPPAPSAPTATQPVVTPRAAPPIATPRANNRPVQWDAGDWLRGWGARLFGRR